jgi:hypothetical protein
MEPPVESLYPDELNSALIDQTEPLTRGRLIELFLTHVAASQTGGPVAAQRAADFCNTITEFKFSGEDLTAAALRRECGMAYLLTPAAREALTVICNARELCGEEAIELALTATAKRIKSGKRRRS